VERRTVLGGIKSGKTKNAMSLMKKLTLFIGLMALGTTSAWASCWQSNSAYEINMAMGRVVVSPDLPVGVSLQLKHGQCRIIIRFMLQHRITTLKSDAKVVAAGLVQGPIKSIQLQFLELVYVSHVGEISMIYPDSYTDRFLL
jgi:hypothetical protein